ncbi:MAG TPA: anhydro-N-acetylmuramic acid kinase [Rhizomicrobium sp.]|nr:anhydro-N-acetylmuramic acid kinase [Rhizomicrobium sp.]
MPEIQKVIGLMSGTSLDGVDAALLETDGADIAIPGPALTIPYSKETRALLRAALDDARKVAEGAPVPQSVREAERHLTEAHAEAVKALLAKAGLAAQQVALIGFHGQTILHRPAQRWTWQIGDGALLARLTGIDVVNDFRSADVKAGGQGAPLMPFYHAVLARKSALTHPRSGSPFGAKHLEGGDAVAGPRASEGRGGLVIVNVGGVANVTYVSGDTVLAFDTGPGNAPIDDWMQTHSGKPVDEDGAFAATGKVDDAALDKMLANDYFDRVPPKSLDRMDFGMEAVKNLSPADGAATLTAFTAASIARAREHFPEPATTWIICGGGRHNKTLMAMLKARVNAPVIAAEEAGWNGDAMEAEGFAYLAMRAKKGLPLSLPTTTGVQQPMTGGKLHRKGIS